MLNMVIVIVLNGHVDQVWLMDCNIMWEGAEALSQKADPISYWKQNAQ